MHFDVVLSEFFIHAQNKVEESSIYSRRVASDVCAGNISQRATVPPTIPSILYARLVPSGSPYIESWYVRFNENAHVGGNV